MNDFLQFMMLAGIDWSDILWATIEAVLTGRGNK